MLIIVSLKSLVLIFNYHTACLKTRVLSHLLCLNKVNWLIDWLKFMQPRARRIYLFVKSLSPHLSTASKQCFWPLICFFFHWTSNFKVSPRTRAKRAWDRAHTHGIWSTSFPLVVTWYDRAYVRVYRLYGWGRGDYQKEGRGVSVESRQVHIFYIGHSQYGQLTAVKTG